MGASAKRACPFCNIDSRSVLLSNEAGFSVPDLFPLTEGHTLIVPHRHVASVYELPVSEQILIWELTRLARESLFGNGIVGFNIGLNDGSAAGQTIGHAHIHVIPRRLGDCQDPRGGMRWIVPEKARYWEQ
jgi:diadenosine tetraphosphate (Ap4A) HIT family hydrolase